jgi:uncharacterized protein (TIGR00730 family)
VTCVAVYCSWQCPAEYALREAAAVGRRLGEAGLKVVFGGGTLGPMGAMAAAARAAGAHVTAVTLPEWVEDGDNGCDELILVDTLAERVAEMERRADAFVVLGGGLGTLHELLSAWTDSCNGSHRKPIVVLDPDGLYAPLWDPDRAGTGRGHPRACPRIGSPTAGRRVASVLRGPGSGLDTESVRTAPG